MLRKARLTDVEAIFSLVSMYAREGLLLPLKEGDICENIRDFCVWDEGEVLGCAALRIFSRELAEVRSVAVHPKAKGRGVGTSLVAFCIDEARSMGLRKVFVLTKSPGFFAKCGFFEVDKRELPHKVWRDCIMCPKFPDCDETAMMLYIK